MSDNMAELFYFFAEDCKKITQINIIINIVTLPKLIHEVKWFYIVWRRASPSNRISIGGMAYSGGSGGNTAGEGSVKVGLKAGNII